MAAESVAFCGVLLTGCRGQFAALSYTLRKQLDSIMATATTGEAGEGGGEGMMAVEEQAGGDADGEEAGGSVKKQE